MKIITAIVSLIITTGPLCAATTPIANLPNKIPCQSASEYISSVNFLNEMKDFKLTSNDINKMADKISTGCTGAAARFITVTKLLTTVGLDTNSVLDNANIFAHKSDAETKTFVEVFKGIYHPDTLDLDAGEALKISILLTQKVHFDSNAVLDDFKHLLKFCVKAKNMDLPPAFCANLAAEVVNIGNDFQVAIAQNYTKLLEFMAFDKTGPELPLNEALKQSREVIAHGPMANENFVNAFLFATSKKGMSLDRKAANDFAKKMAARSYRLESK